MEKKTWTVPELIVLVRSKPEEAVLTGCKVTDKTGSQNLAAACYQTCSSSCDSLVGS
jgi:hypothetical protein